MLRFYVDNFKVEILAVTVRERDSMQQERDSLDELTAKLMAEIEI